MNLILQILKHIFTLALLRPTRREFPVLTFRIRGDGFGRRLDFWSEVLIKIGRHVFSSTPVTPENGFLNALRL
jgi:hypothetical protein